jgi:hypothetical protein
MGPLRLFLQVHKYQKDETAWWLLGADAKSVANAELSAMNKIESAYANGFGGIQYCLSHCVQVCLAN